MLSHEGLPFWPDAAWRDAVFGLLTESEYELLKALATNAGRLLTQRHLIREVWGELPSEEGLRQLRSTIQSLRQKLEPNPTQPRHIGLEPGVGYRLWTES